MMYFIITLVPVVVLVVSCFYALFSRYLSWGFTYKKNQTIACIAALISLLGMKFAVESPNNVFSLTEIHLIWTISALFLITTYVLTGGSVLYLVVKPQFLRKNKTCVLVIENITPTCVKCSKNCIFNNKDNKCPAQFPCYSLVKGKIFYKNKDTGIKGTMIIHNHDYSSSKQEYKVRVQYTEAPDKEVIVGMI